MEEVILELAALQVGKKRTEAIAARANEREVVYRNTITGSTAEKISIERKAMEIARAISQKWEERSKDSKCPDCLNTGFIQEVTKAHHYCYCERGMERLNMMLVLLYQRDILK